MDGRSRGRFLSVAAVEPGDVRNQADFKKIGTSREFSGLAGQLARPSQGPFDERPGEIATRPVSGIRETSKAIERSKKYRRLLLLYEGRKSEASWLSTGCFLGRVSRWEDFLTVEASSPPPAT